MEELLPGLWHYTAFHPRIRQVVHSHFLTRSRTLFDPMVPVEGLRMFGTEFRPARIVLSNRHHWRGAQEFADEFGCPVLAPLAGLHEFRDGRHVSGYAIGGSPAEDVRALRADALAPDDTVLRLDVGRGALLFADALIAWDDGLSFMPDFLMDDPERTRAGLLADLRAVLDEDFDTLLFAHGDPVVRGGKAVLAAFVEAGGHTPSVED
ncbi:MAG TPA: hypothetical protein VK279_00100 [Solirubrobacteraceae bacterium]|nr:hypothetical protein [Solirubrobacteraceae bacterium]